MKKDKFNKKNSPQKSAKKFEEELPEVARRLSIRVSSPYGYYPEDVDKIILRLEQDISNLEKDNLKLSKELESQSKQSSALKSELSKIKMQVSLMEIPDASTEESFMMLGKMETITGNVETIPVNTVESIPHVDIKPVEAEHSSNPPKTYANLVKPKSTSPTPRLKL